MLNSSNLSNLYHPMTPLRNNHDYDPKPGEYMTLGRFPLKGIPGKSEHLILIVPRIQPNILVQTIASIFNPKVTFKSEFIGLNPLSKQETKSLRDLSDAPQKTLKYIIFATTFVKIRGN